MIARSLNVVLLSFHAASFFAVINDLKRFSCSSVGSANGAEFSRE